MNSINERKDAPDETPMNVSMAALSEIDASKSGNGAAAILRNEPRRPVARSTLSFGDTSRIKLKKVIYVHAQPTLWIMIATQ